MSILRFQADHKIELRRRLQSIRRGLNLDSRVERRAHAEHQSESARGANVVVGERREGHTLNCVPIIANEHVFGFAWSASAKTNQQSNCISLHVTLGDAQSVCKRPKSLRTTPSKS